MPSSSASRLASSAGRLATKLASFGLVTVVVACTSACGPSKAAIDVSRVVRESTRETLVPFDSDDELKSYVKKLAKARQTRDEATSKDYAAADSPQAESAPPPSAAPAESAGADESITNVQEQGVDEGGIVKTRGDHLVVLRRGRLFSIDVSGEDRKPISMVNAFPRGPRVETWYDEMLISGNTIIVVGYSYGAGGTELGLFHIDDEGHITRRSTQYLRSDDYYSSRNYASRLLGDKLVFYMPQPLFGYGSDELTLPGFRRSRAGDWTDITSATQIYRPIQPTEYPVLHTVVTCDVGSKLSCSARGVIGPYGRNFYVSQSAVYVWVHEGHGGYDEDGQKRRIEDAPGVVYRLPLGGGDVGALRVWGVPTDQFSFKETDDNLHVLVRSEGGGDWMWSPEASAGSVALMSVPVAGFTTKVGTAKREAYTELPHPGEAYDFQNRFIGDYVVYGTGSGWGHAAEETSRKAFFHPYRQGGKTRTLALPHGVDRLEALGQHAMVIGSDGKNLHFSSVELGEVPAVTSRYVQQAANQGETRSHGFFFKPSGARDGVLGLPIRGGSEAGGEHLVHGSASVLFLEVDNLKLGDLGSLAALSRNDDDACVMSCVDWYGNARPIFYKQRVFALMGYELVEGKLGDGKISEVGRVNFHHALASKSKSVRAK